MNKEDEIGSAIFGMFMIFFGLIVLYLIACLVEPSLDNGPMKDILVQMLPN